MKLKECLDIGHACGLDTPEECIRNIELHSTQLFLWTEIEKELDELKADCAANGVDYEKAFDTVIVAGKNKLTGKAETWMPNIPNTPEDIAFAFNKITNEGYDAEIVESMR